jgi:hypothetical protein
MVTKSFSAQLDDIADLTLRDMRYVASESIQDVAEQMQTPQRGVTKGGTFEVGKIPVAESDLINSLSVDGGAEGEDAYVLALAGYELGDNMTFAYSAEHALPMETGFTIELADGGEVNVPGRHFMGKAAARFPEFVKARAAEVRR